MHTSGGAQAASRAAAVISPWWLWFPEPPDSPSPLLPVAAVTALRDLGIQVHPCPSGEMSFPTGQPFPLCHCKAWGWPGPTLTRDHSIPPPGSEAWQDPGSPAAGRAALPHQLPHSGAANKQTNRHPQHQAPATHPLLTTVITVRQLASSAWNLVCKHGFLLHRSGKSNLLQGSSNFRRGVHVVVARAVAGDFYLGLLMQGRNNRW